MRDDNTSIVTPAPAEPKRGFADPNEQAKRAPESTGQVVDGQRVGVGENVAKHKQDIAQDLTAAGQDTQARKDRNASRDVETADVNVQKMKKLFENKGKEEQKPSPERAARDAELMAMKGTGKVSAMRAELEKKQTAAKTTDTKSTSNPKAPAQTTTAAKGQTTTAAKSATQPIPAGGAGQKGVPSPPPQGQDPKAAQQGQGEKKKGGALKKFGKMAMAAALFVVNPILGMLAALLFMATGKKKERGGPANQTPQKQQQQGMGPAIAKQQEQGITAAPSKQTPANAPQAMSLADKPIISGIVGGKTQTPAKDAKQQVTVPENAKQSIKDRANALSQAMGHGEVGTRAATTPGKQSPEQQKTTIGISSKAQPNVRAQAEALIRNSGAQVGKPSNVQSASKGAATGVAQQAATGKGRQ